MKRLRDPLCSLLSLSLALPAAAVGQDSPAPDPAARARSLGFDLPIAVFPVGLLGRPDRDVGNALGLLLEQRGMAKLEPSAAEFAADAAGSWDATVAGFAAHVRRAAAASVHGLYAEIAGTRATGVQAVRFVLVDGDGAVVFAEATDRADADLAKALGGRGEPMSCCLFVANRIAALLRLPAAVPAAAGQGRFARLWAEKSGTPDAAERAAMRQRRAEMAAAHTARTFAVLPTRVGDATDGDSAGRLAAGLAELGVHAAVAPAPAPKIVLAPTSNEQKRLWDFARGLREHLRRAPVDADYVVMADYLVDAERGARGSVHLVVCDRQGDWVEVDFQNDHHPDYASAAPRSAADSDRVALVRLRRMLR